MSTGAPPGRPLPPLRWAALAFSAALAACTPPAPPVAGGPLPPAIAATCFTPGEDCTGLIVARIEAARREVLVQAYDFTSRPIAAALIDARRRGIEVRVILDKADVCWESRHRDEPAPVECPKLDRVLADRLAGAGIRVQIDTRHHISHNKVMVIDAAQVITGSFNFTRSAQDFNAENLVVLDDAATAARYRANWQTHAGHSLDYPGR